jgi:hypothetical protein
MAMRLNNAAASAAADSTGLRAYINNASTPILKFYTGSVNGTAESDPAGTLLATVTLAAFGAATDGAIASTGGSVAAGASGTAGCCQNHWRRHQLRRERVAVWWDCHSWDIYDYCASGVGTPGDRVFCVPHDGLEREGDIRWHSHKQDRPWTHGPWSRRTRYARARLWTCRMRSPARYMWTSLWALQRPTRGQGC